jgi:hypothetical protein
VEGLTLLPLTSKGVYNILIYNLILQQQGCNLNFLLILITLHKREKELKRHFPNLIKTLIYKRPSSFLFNNKSLKIQ